MLELELEGSRKHRRTSQGKQDKSSEKLSELRVPHPAHEGSTASPHSPSARNCLLLT